MRKICMLAGFLFLLAAAFEFAQAAPGARAASGAKPKAARAASSSGAGGAKSTRSGASKSSGSKGGSQKGGAKKDKSKSSSSGKEEEAAPVDPALSGPEGCLVSKIGGLLASDCSFLVDEAISAGMGSDPLLCVYNGKDAGSAKSVYNIFLRQYYGISEGGVKASTSLVDVRDQKKGAMKYWQYIIDEAGAGTLKENKIFDSVTEAVLENSSLSSSDQLAIEGKSVDTVELSIPLVKSDLERCAKSAKAAMNECKAVSDISIKKKIAASCTAYEAVLVKMAGAKKAEAMGFESEIVAVLQQRLRAELDNTRNALDREQEKAALDSQKLAAQTDTEIAKTMEKRTKLVLEASGIMNDIAELEAEDEDEKKDYQADLDEVN
ncbi:MAG: hypothetical protein LBO78_00150, partial [Rickettsiales bacterium]|nr:hypothetical protein [Rickettsiales bacterium]